LIQLKVCRRAMASLAIRVRRWPPAHPTPHGPPCRRRTVKDCSPRPQGAVTALIAANLGLVLVNRSWTIGLWRNLRRPNPAVWIVVAAAAAVLALAFGLPAARNVFHFAAIDLGALLGAGALGAGAALWFEIPKACGLLRRLG